MRLASSRLLERPDAHMDQPVRRLAARRHRIAALAQGVVSTLASSGFDTAAICTISETAGSAGCTLDAAPPAAWLCRGRQGRLAPAPAWLPPVRGAGGVALCRCLRRTRLRRRRVRARAPIGAEAAHPHPAEPARARGLARPPKAWERSCCPAAAPDREQRFARQAARRPTAGAEVVMAHRVPQPEAQPADQHQAEERWPAARPSPA